MSADISRVLGEMRALQARISPTATPATEAAPGSDFATLLKGSVDRVAGMQSQARALASAFESGDRSVDLTRVMLETQKASLAFRAMTEVRNKLIDAYHEIMNMQV
ncbi:MAG: flagellar hook-basal body complex protein FliE [Proteobacteria bacterium]|nr:flagellar hook-basal body complex protein FliE [Pseudomonadota bacterium]